MEYKVFLSCVKERIEKMCDLEDKISVKEIVKNNAVKLDALIISRKNESISPTIYLNSMYQDFLNGASIEEICTNIMEIDANSRGNIDISSEIFMDFEKMKSKIMFKLINTEMNEDILKDLPHRDFLDLSIVYYCYLDEISDNSATAVIHYSNMEMWGIGEEILYDLAMNNSPLVLPAEIKSMKDTLLELMDEELNEEILNLNDEDFLPMYVLSNKKRLFGAACIKYENLVDACSAKLGGDFFIIPSSVHELILVLADESVNPVELKRMVEDVNSTQVAVDEVLSNNVYRYNSNIGRISIINIIK